MNTETELPSLLDRALEGAVDGRPSVPATSYLREARRIRRRRRVVSALAVVPILAAAVGMGHQVWPEGDSGSAAADPAGHASPAPTAQQLPDPDIVLPEPANHVEVINGLDGVDWFTTPDIPEWAQEFGNHGPVGLAPDGRLWVAPDAVVRRVVVDPLTSGDGDRAQGVTSSYAVEAECTCLSEEFGGDVAWVLLWTDGTGPGAGWMDNAGRWTGDFEVWVDDATADRQGRPNLAERLVRWAGPQSDQLVPASPGVEVVRQSTATGFPPRFATRGAVAEVTYAGTTWFVMAADPRGSAGWMKATSGDVVGSLSEFVDSWRQGT